MKRSTLYLHRDEVLQELVKQIFSYPVETGSMDTDLGTFATFKFKKSYDLDDIIGQTVSVKSKLIKIYGTEGLEQKSRFEDGVDFIAVYDFVKRHWAVINISTKEEVVCLGQFGFNDEGKGFTSITTNDDSIRTWQQLKDFDWKKNGR